MVTELVFNEFSLQNQAENVFQAKENLFRLLKCCQQVRPFQFKHLRVSEHFYEQALFQNYTITHWLNDESIVPTLKSLLIDIARSPYIPEEDEVTQDSFIQNYYYLNCPEHTELHNQPSEGLAVAFLYNTLAVSLKTHPVWNQTELELLEKAEAQENQVRVRHISEPEQISAHKTWLEENRPVELIKTDLAPEDKSIKLRDDHGKDILQSFSERLIRSPYVLGVINSLPFNPRSLNFIHDVIPNGLIEIVLTWTDSGLGLVVQSTGRNLQETNAIADILNKEFGR